MSLPHQLNEIKPDEIVLPEEEPPKEHINPMKKQEAMMHSSVNEAYKELLKEDQKIEKTKKRIDNHFEEIKKIIA